jgi:sugar lactone lactonase YvrE
VRCAYCGASAPVPEALRSRETPQVVIRVDRPAEFRTTKGAGGGTAGIIVSLGVTIAIIGVVIAIITSVNSTLESNIGEMPSEPDVQSTVMAALPTQETATLTPAPSPTPRYANPVLSFGAEGTGAGKFEDARSIGVDGKGNLYVAEYTGGRVQVFDANGKFLSTFFAGNAKTLILGFAVDRKGTVYVADGRYITRYDGATGKSLGKLNYSGGPGFGELATTPDGGIVAMWYQRREGIFTSTEGAREDLVRFDAEGKVTLVISAPISSQTDEVALQNELAVDGQGNLYLLSYYAGAIYKFSPEGKYINNFASHGNGPGQFSQASSIAIDSHGQIYLADSDRVHIYAADGHYVRSFGLDQSTEVLLFDDQDDLITLDRTRIVKYVLGL